MVDHWRWHGSARVSRWARLTATIGVLLAGVLLAALPSAAFASAPEMRGEWEIAINNGQSTITGTTIISNEANGQGHFESGVVKYNVGVTGTFEGALEGSTATVKATTAPFGPVGEGKFESKTMKVESGVGTLALSGTGTLELEKTTGPATLTATRIKTHKELEEQEEREKQEREEKEARANVRGEWALTLEDGPEKVSGIALITTEANPKNEFVSSAALFESAIPGAFSGTLQDGKATVKITTEAGGPYPAGEFTSTKILVSSTNDPTSMSGSGKLTLGPTELEGTQLTATRIKTYQEVLEREANEGKAKEQQEREATEAREKAEREAKEKTEREIQEKTARAAKEKTEHEAQEKAAREAKEKIEREAREAAEKAAKKTKLVSVQLAGKSFTVGATELLSLPISNPNPYAISGRVTLLMSKSSRSAGKKIGSLGTVSFGISPDGKQVINLKLSTSGREEVAHQATLRAIATITTKASGQTTTTKTFDLTLRAARPAHSKN